MNEPWLDNNDYTKPIDLLVNQKKNSAVRNTQKPIEKVLQQEAINTTAIIESQPQTVLPQLLTKTIRTIVNKTKPEVLQSAIKGIQLPYDVSITGLQIIDNPTISKSSSFSGIEDTNTIGQQGFTILKEPDELDILASEEIRRYLTYEKDKSRYKISNIDKYQESIDRIDSLIVDNIEKKGLVEPELIYDLAGEPSRNIMETLLGNNWNKDFTPMRNRSIFNYKTLPLPIVAALHNGYNGILGMFTGKKNENYISQDIIDLINKAQDYKEQIYNIAAHSKAVKYSDIINGNPEMPAYIYVDPSIDEEGTDEYITSKKTTKGYINESIGNFVESFIGYGTNILSTLAYGRDKNGKDLLKWLLYPSEIIKGGVTPKFMDPDNLKILAYKSYELGIAKDENDFKSILENIEDPRQLWGSLGSMAGSLTADVMYGGFKWGGKLGSALSLKTLNSFNKSKELVQAVDYTKLMAMPKWKQITNAVGWSMNPASWGKEVKYTDALAPSIYAQLGHPFQNMAHMAVGGLGSYMFSMDPSMTVEEAATNLEDMATLGFLTSILGNTLGNTARFLRPLVKGTTNKLFRKMVPVLSEDPLVHSKQMENTVNVLYRTGIAFALPLPQMLPSLMQLKPPDYNNDLVQNVLMGIWFTGAGIRSGKQQRRTTEKFAKYYEKHPKTEELGFKTDRTFYDIFEREAIMKGADPLNLTGRDLLDLSPKKSMMETRGIFNDALRKSSKDIKVKPMNEPAYNREGIQQFSLYNPAEKTVYVDNTIRNPNINVNYVENFGRIFEHEIGHDVLVDTYNTNPEFKTEVDNLFDKAKEQYNNKESKLNELIGNNTELQKTADYIFKEQSPQEFLAHIFDEGAKSFIDILEKVPVESSEKGQLSFFEKLKDIFIKEPSIAGETKKLIALTLSDKTKGFIEPIEDNYDILKEPEQPLGMPLESLKSFREKERELYTIENNRLKENGKVNINVNDRLRDLLKNNYYLTNEEINKLDNTFMFYNGNFTEPNSAIEEIIYNKFYPKTKMSKVDYNDAQRKIALKSNYDEFSNQNMGHEDMALRVTTEAKNELADIIANTIIDFSIKDKIHKDNVNLFPTGYFNQELNSGLFGMTSTSLVQSELIPGKREYKEQELQYLVSAIEDYNRVSKGLGKNATLFDMVNSYQREYENKPKDVNELTGYIQKKIQEETEKVPLTEPEVNDILKNMREPLPEFLHKDTEDVTKHDANENPDKDIGDINDNGIMLGLDSNNSVVEFFRNQTKENGEPLRKKIIEYYTKVNPDKSPEQLQDKINHDYLVISNTIPRKMVALKIDTSFDTASKKHINTIEAIPDNRNIDTNGDNISTWTGKPQYLIDGLDVLNKRYSEIGGKAYKDSAELLKELFVNPDIIGLSEIETYNNDNFTYSQQIKGKIPYWQRDQLLQQGYYTLPKSTGVKFLYSKRLSQIAQDPLLAAKTVIQLEALARKHYLINDTTWNYDTKKREQVENILPYLNGSMIIQKAIHGKNFTDGSLIWANTDQKIKKDILESGLIPQIIKKLQDWIPMNKNKDDKKSSASEFIYWKDKKEDELIMDQIYSAKSIDDIPKYIHKFMENINTILDSKINSLMSPLLDSGDALRTVKTYKTIENGKTYEHAEKKKLVDKYLSTLTTDDKFRLNSKDDLRMFIPESVNEDGTYNQEWLNSQSAVEINGEYSLTSHIPDPRLTRNSEIAFKLNENHSDSAYFFANKPTNNVFKQLTNRPEFITEYKTKQLIIDENGNTILPKTYLNGKVLNDDSVFANFIKTLGKEVSLIGTFSAMKGKSPYRVHETESYTDPDVKLVLSQVGEILGLRNKNGDYYPAFIDNQKNPEPFIKRELDYISDLYDNGTVPHKLDFFLPMTGKGAMSIIGSAKIQNGRVKTSIQTFNNPGIHIGSFLKSPYGKIFSEAEEQFNKNRANSSLNKVSNINTFNLVTNKLSLGQIPELNPENKFTEVQNAFKQYAESVGIKSGEPIKPVTEYKTEELLQAQQGLKEIFKQLKSMDPEMSKFFSNIELEQLYKIMGDVETYQQFPKEKLPLLMAVTNKIFAQSELSSDRKPTLIQNTINKEINSANILEVDANTVTLIPDTDAIGDIRRMINYELKTYESHLDEEYKSGRIDETEYESKYSAKENELARSYTEILDTYIDIEKNTYHAGSQGYTLDYWTLQSLNNNKFGHKYGLFSKTLNERKATGGPHYLKAGIITGLSHSANSGTMDSYTTKIMGMDNDKDGFQVIVPDENLTPDIFDKIHFYQRNLGLDKGAYSNSNDLINSLKTRLSGDNYAINELLGIAYSNRINRTQHYQSYDNAINIMEDRGITYNSRKLISQALQNIPPLSNGKKQHTWETNNATYTLDDRDTPIILDNKREINRAVLLTDLATQGAVDNYGHLTFDPTEAILEGFFDIKPKKKDLSRFIIFNEIKKELLKISGQGVEYGTKFSSKNPLEFVHSINNNAKELIRLNQEGKLNINSVPSRLLTGLVANLSKYPADIGTAKNNEIFKQKIDNKTADMMSDIAIDSFEYSNLTIEQLNEYHNILQKTFLPLLNSLPSRDNPDSYYRNKDGNIDLLKTFNTNYGKDIFGYEPLRPFTDIGEYGDFKKALGGTIYSELYKRFPPLPGKKNLFTKSYNNGNLNVSYDNGNITGKNLGTGESRQVNIKDLFNENGLNRFH